MMTWMDKCWTTCSKNRRAIIEHERLEGRLKEKSNEVQKRSSFDATMTKDIESLIEDHRKHAKEMIDESEYFVFDKEKGIPSLLTEDGKIKEQIRWIQDCQKYLQDALKEAKRGDSDAVSNHMEDMIAAENMARNTVEDCDTHLRQRYADHLTKVHMCLIRS